MDQVILTRFNLPSAGAESVIRAQDGWLTDRVRLFERFCLPSVAAQTDRRFSWLIYFDPESPAWLREVIRGHADAGHYVPIFRADVSREELLDDIAQVAGRSSAELLTTNLDNDDGLANDFVQRTRAQPEPELATAYYFTNGLIRSQYGVYRRRDPHNAFPSVRAPWSSPMTCWSAWHNRLAQRLPVVQIGDEPGWLQVVHGRNVSNKIRGRLVSPAAYAPQFGSLLDGVPEPGIGALVHDRLLAVPSRSVRDGGRSVAKSAVMRLLGPDGFESAKRLLAGRRRDFIHK